MTVSWVQPEECEPVLTATVIVSLPSGVGTVAENRPLEATVSTTVVLSVVEPGWAEETDTSAPGVVVPLTTVEPLTSAPLVGEVMATGSTVGAPPAT